MDKTNKKVVFISVAFIVAIIAYFILTNTLTTKANQNNVIYTKDSKKIDFLNNNDVIENHDYVLTGTIVENYEIPDIDYEKQEKEMTNQSGIGISVGHFEFVPDEINERNLKIQNGEIEGQSMYSLIPPTIPPAKYPFNENLYNILEFTYSPFYFNAKNFLATSNDNYRAYIYNLNDEIINVIDSKDGIIRLNSESLNDFYVLFISENNLSNISIDLHVSN